MKTKIKLVLYPLIFIFIFFYVRYQYFENEESHNLNSYGTRDDMVTCLKPCKFAARWRLSKRTGFIPNENLIDIVFKTVQGVGRTGNYVIALRIALNLAIHCKKVIKLPDDDTKGKAFEFDQKFSILDFSWLNSTMKSYCKTIKFPIHENARFFWYLANKHKDLSYRLEKSLEYDSLNIEYERDVCFQKYLGICDKNYCTFDAQNSLKNSPDTLVMHLRQGDLFKPGFKSNVARGKGQPPLSYYLAALKIANWSNVLIVTEPGIEGPIGSIFKIINDSLIVPVHWQKSNWHDDLRTILCARNLVASKSTLDNVLIYGYAKILISYRCLENFPGNKQLYRIRMKNYSPFINHDNSPAEWIKILLHPVNSVENC